MRGIFVQATIVGLLVGLVSCGSPPPDYGSGVSQTGLEYELLSPLEQPEPSKHTLGDNALSGASINRVTVEIERYPLSKDDLESTLNEIIEPIKPSYDEIVVSVKYHRGERSPAYGNWSWGPTPEDVENLEVLDKDRYDWQRPNLTKFNDRNECTIPSALDFEVMESYWGYSDAISKGESAFEQTMNEYNISRAEYDAIREEVAEWSSC